MQCHKRRRSLSVCIKDETEKTVVGSQGEARKIGGDTHTQTHTDNEQATDREVSLCVCLSGGTQCVQRPLQEATEADAPVLTYGCC